MTARVFVDTNVLVYARDVAELKKRPQAVAWLDALWANHCGSVSYQVLHEYYATVTRKFSPGLPVAEAREHVRALFAWQPVPPTLLLIETAWKVQDRYSLSWWDSLIMAAAQIGGCQFLLSEDLSAGQDYSGVRVINPFATEPADVLR